jgi:hypothetical protein
MNPNPFSELNHFTVPCAIFAAPVACSICVTHKCIKLNLGHSST